MIIVVAGIKRSASTVQYNLIRIALEKAGYIVRGMKAGYQPRGVPNGAVDLVKKHPYRRDLAEAADHIFLTTRGNEEIRKSLQRFYGRNFNMSEVLAMREEYNKWARHTTPSYEFPFELWMGKPEDYTRQIVSLLGVVVDPLEVLRVFRQIKPPENEYDPETCLFPNHITQ